MQEPPGIIFEDTDIVVVNKPSGMTVNKADTTKSEETVQDWVMAYSTWPLTKGIMQKGENGEYSPEWEFYNRAGIVHRLDKETSGILLIAKNVQSFIVLQNQFKERHVKKTYTALIHGNIFPKEGEINAPVGRLEFNRKRFGVVAGGREAVTKYKTVGNYEVRVKNYVEKVTLLELYPKTGRTHQIRVHLKYLNHPIFSDDLYAGRKTSRQDRKLLSRLFLHASGIQFSHPVTHDPISFQAPLPLELNEFISKYAVSVL